MYQNVDIYLGDKVIGSGEIRREGLYYNIHCKCDLTGKVMYRLMLQCGGRSHNLGICIPEGKHFVLNTKIPVSKIGHGEISIFPVPKGNRQKDLFIPVSPDEPFAYLSRLENAVLECRDGKIGVRIANEDQSSICKPTGQ